MNKYLLAFIFYFLILGLIKSVELQATHPSNLGFIFTYNGPDTIFVGENCTGILDWGAPDNPIISQDPNNPGLIILQVTINISGGYSIGSEVPAGTTVMVEYRIIDINNQVHIFPFSIYFDDNAPPVFNPQLLPPSITVSCQVNNEIPENAIMDNCTAESDIVVVIQDNETFDPCINQMIQRVFTATDERGNSSTYQQIITVIPDASAPILVTPPSDRTVNCNIENSADAFTAWLSTQGGAIFSDNCDSLIYTTIPESPSLSEGCNEAYEVFFVATDVCGNSTAVSAFFTILDDQPPVVNTPPGGLVYFCDSLSIMEQFIQWLLVDGLIDVSDECTALEDLIITPYYQLQELTEELLAELIESQVEEGCLDQVTIGEETYINVLVLLEVIFEVEDLCGNIMQVGQTFAVIDEMPPVLEDAATDLTIPCGSQEELENQLVQWLETAGGATGSDACGYFRFTTERTFEDIILDFRASQSDYCGRSGWVEVSFFLSDYCGNQLSEPTTAIFTVIDTIPPQITTFPEAVILECNKDISMEIIALINNQLGAEASDECGEIRWTQFEWMDSEGREGIVFFGDESNYPTPTEISCSWTLQLEMEVEDECGNISIASGSITVNDTSEPFFEEEQQEVTISCGDINAIPEPVAFDNCLSEPELVMLNETSTQGTDPLMCNFYTYTISRVWRATDACGNSSEAVQVIHVQDTLPPVFDLPNTFQVNCDADIVPDTALVLSMILDNCSPTVQFSYVDSGFLGICPGDFQVERRLQATDVCGNSSSFVQQFVFTDTAAPIIVTPPQNLVTTCSDRLMIPGLFQDWIEERGGAVVEDDCSEVAFFAAVPGSYDLEDPSTFPGTMPVPSSEGGCMEDFFINQEIDFVFYDECSNAIMYSVFFRVIDDVPPIFLECLPAVTLNNTATLCEAELEVRSPFATDDCYGLGGQMILEQTLLVTSADPGNPNVAVDDLVFNLEVDLAPGQVILAPAQLIINLQQIDGGATPKFFYLEDEAGTRIGQTSALAESCDSGFFVFNFNNVFQMNQWAADGVISFRLTPNLPSGSAPSGPIADICDGSNVSARFTFSISEASFITYEYAINGGNRVLGSPLSGQVEVLPVGNHTIQYFATDCFGNESVCSQLVSVIDIEKPEIECPSDIVYTLAIDECDFSTMIPLPVSFSDNCGFPNRQMMQAENFQDSLLTFGYDELQDIYIAQSKSYQFVDFSNILPEGMVRLHITFKGYRTSEESYFTFTDDEGNPLGNTQANFSLDPECQEAITYTIEVSRDMYESWYTKGEVIIEALPQTDPTTGSGIQPCQDIEVGDGDTDGVSYLSIALEVSGYQPQYFVTGATQAPLTAISNILAGPEITFQMGQSFFHYVVEDSNGLQNSCTVSVQVIDTIAPTAVCRNAIISINPSGTINYVLTPNEVDNGSSDNCGIISRVVTPNVFDCSMIGQEVLVSLTVTDAFGLSDVCTSRVRIERFVLEPQFTLDICQPDTLRLLANLSVLLSPSDYTFQWTGPNGFTSNAINPIISNVNSSLSGTYTLRIQGFGGCFAEGTVTIIIPEVLGTPGLQVERPIVCEGSLVRLETQSFSGNVTYKWYSGTAPNGTLLANTSSPGYESLFAPGAYSFYVVVETPNCISAPSVSRPVTVLSTIQAAVNEDYIEICSGELLQFGTPVTGPDIQYLWLGPSQFESVSRNPIVSPTAGVANSGIYTLQIFQSGCPSTIAQVEVFVTPRPQTPILTTNQEGCPGEQLILNVNNVPNADQYIWSHPDGSQITTSNNFLTIPNTSEALNGIWTARILDRGCSSFISNAVAVDIEPLFLFEATNNGPVCVGEMVTLNVSELPGGSYVWTGPVAAIEPIRSPSFVPQGGVYTVNGQTARGCLYESQTSVIVNDRPFINALSTTAEACANGIDPSCFQATVIPMNPGDYTFSWTGPGFSSNDEVACIPNTSSQNNGTYTLIVTNGLNCKSDPVSIELSVKDIPEKPNLSIRDFFCEGGSIELEMDPVPGATYSWVTPLGTISTTNPELIISNGSALNAGLYGLYITVDGCTSDTSDLIAVNIRPRPSRPIITGDNFVCEGDSIQLQTGFVPGAVYAWMGPAGFQSNELGALVFPATVASEGDYTLRISVQGCESPAALPFFVKVQALPIAPRLETEASILCARRQGFELNLCVKEEDVEPGVRYSWFNAMNDERLGGPFTSRCFNISDLDRLEDGINEFYVISSVSGCLSDRSAALQVRVDKLPEISADAGPDLVACNQDEVLVQAQSPSIGSGVWLALDNFLGIDMETSATTSVFGLRPGLNQVAWSLNYRSCIDYSRDTVNITFQIEPVLEDDFFVIPFAGSRRIDVLQNDQLPEVFIVDIVTEPQHGTLIAVGENRFEFLAVPNYVGSDAFTYRVCAVACPSLCKEARVMLEIGDESVCDVPTIITPNDDGINDVFFIPCLSSNLFPNNRVTIFNEWGGKVFEESPYSNEWQGTYKGQPVPVGTYFFVVEFGNGRPPQKGFLMIKR